MTASDLSKDVLTPADVISYYQQEKSLRAVSRKYGISTSAATKILCTAGIYPSNQAVMVHRMMDAGQSIEEIAGSLHVSVKSLDKYLPYQRIPYSVGAKSENAKRLTVWRERRKNHEEGHQ